MKPTITVNQYPIGWEWLDRVPLEDFTWLIEIFSTMTDNTDTYDFVGYTDSETLPGQQKVCSVDRIPLANFLNDDQGFIRNEEIYQAHKYTHPTNKIRYIISQTLILTLYTSSLILVSYTYRIILRYI